MDASKTEMLSCCFKSESGEVAGDMMELPLDCTVQQLTLICNAILHQEDPMPYLFYVNNTEITDSLQKALNVSDLKIEGVVDIIYQQQAIFKVRPVTRCTSSMPGHAEAVISVSFSPDGKHLASGSGDTTVRFWDVNTQTPSFTCKQHTNWVLCIAWSPDSMKLASACKDGKINIWDPFTGNQLGKTMVGHKQWITSLCWEPYHKNPECRLLASSSKDGDIRIWNTVLCRTELTISGHTKSVTVVKWGGSGLIYSASQDRTVKVWRAKDGVLCRTLDGHAHWVNTLALNTDYILRIGAFDPVKDSDKDTIVPDKKKSQDFALKRYYGVTEPIGERLVSGSDDFTLFLWDPEKDRKPLARLTGHQQLVNDVKFSPDGRLLASASFDKSIKLWDSKTGKFICTFRGHVQAVYMVSFSADSRLMVSGSADSTLKLWNLKTKKLEIDLPGHGDQIYAVDWSTDGLKVASGGKDKVLRLWQN
ncbi:notchless protein homolog 1 [Leptinotarsa decemlineata]|uniref:notchless protein homolog 1 n=1 Tax=Leptinotarsa decemlineata TaxID=7539 RepID=UPI000C25426C|nr:notchless protein homolog 1 [Leptinotarsa decemlineata]